VDGSAIQTTVLCVVVSTTLHIDCTSVRSHTQLFRQPRSPVPFSTTPKTKTTTTTTTARQRKQHQHQRFFVVMTAALATLSQLGLVPSLLSRGGGLVGKTAVPSTVTNSRLRALYAAWFSNVASPIRFFVSGTTGNFFLFRFEQLAYQLLSHANFLPPFLESHMDSLSFFLGYIILLPTQHLLNAILTFGIDTIDTREKYWKTLIAEVKVYVTALCGSTILNAILMQTGWMSKTTVFILTLCIFSCFNYIVINVMVHRAVDSAPRKDDIKNVTGKKGKGIRALQAPRGGGGRGERKKDMESSHLSWHNLDALSVHDLVVGTGTPVHAVDESWGAKKHLLKLN
jgi:hypothetical protein